MVNLFRRTLVNIKRRELVNLTGKSSMDICTRKNNQLLYTVLVNLTGSEIEYYIYEYDVLSERVEKAYSDYLLKPKKDGAPRKDIAFRWYDFKFFTADDYARKNNWDILGFNGK